MAEFNDVLYKSRTNVFSGAKNLSKEVTIKQFRTHDSFSDNLLFLDKSKNLVGSFFFGVPFR